MPTSQPAGVRDCLPPRHARPAHTPHHARHGAARPGPARPGAARPGPARPGTARPPPLAAAQACSRTHAAPCPARHGAPAAARRGAGMFQDARRTMPGPARRARRRTPRRRHVPGRTPHHARPGTARPPPHAAAQACSRTHAAPRTAHHGAPAAARTPRQSTARTPTGHAEFGVARPGSLTYGRKDSPRAPGVQFVGAASAGPPNTVLIIFCCAAWNAAAPERSASST
ncbi:hypothetical protein DFR68_106604 [Nocardia mexicana]|uniref:Uncharacterized protein n=1 Tax=Nocardia mexicana TaxID=279262 RepID=A0A370H2B9_9NOCA|nr:hypothetical protein DFR68_106604 [Nocardia mexicana]